MVLWVRRTSLQAIGTALALILIGASSARDGSDQAPRSRAAHAACELFNTNLVADPGFEVPRITHAPYVPLVGGDSISAWMVLGSIDLISADYWNAAEGGQSVDLDGCGMGGVTQIVPTRAGAKYELCFALATNPDGPPTIKTLEVLWDGKRVAKLTVSSAGSTRQEMRWTYHRYDVVGRGGTSVLTFRSLTEGCYGAVIDDVKLQEKRAAVVRSDLSSNDRVSLLLASFQELEAFYFCRGQQRWHSAPLPLKRASHPCGTGSVVQAANVTCGWFPQLVTHPFEHEAIVVQGLPDRVLSNRGPENLDEDALSGAIEREGFPVDVYEVRRVPQE